MIVDADVVLRQRGRGDTHTHTCFLMTSVACMMQRGGNPWFRASRMACSSVTLRVQLLTREETT